MKMIQGKSVLVTLLVVAILFNPVAGMAGAASSLPGAAAGGNVFRQSASALGSLFYGGESAFAGSRERGGEELYAPLLDSVGEIFKFLAEDEELKEVLGVVLDEILEDERIAGYDTDALLVRTLRDERLVKILGKVISRHLRDEEFLSALARLTGDLAALLKDPALVGGLHKTVIALLEDERVNEFVFEIASSFLVYADQIVKSAGDDRTAAALSGLLDDIAGLFEAPILKYSGELRRDERVAEALDKIREIMQGPDSLFIENLKSDAKFNRALKDLQALFLEPLSADISGRLLEGIRSSESLQNSIELLLAGLKDIGEYSEETGQYVGAYDELFGVLELLQSDLGIVLEEIGAEVDSAIDHYSEHGPFDEPQDEGAGGCKLVGMGSPGSHYLSVDSGEVEDQVSDFINYWAEVAGWVLNKKIERGDLEPIIDQYFSEDSPYLSAIEGALSGSAETAGENLRTELDIVVTEHTAGLEERLEARLFGAPGDEEDGGLMGEVSTEMGELVAEITEEKLEEMESTELLALLEGRSEEFSAVLKELIAAFPLEFSGSSGPAGRALSLSLLNKIALELPFEVLADLIDETDVQGFLGGLGKLVDELPLDTLVPYLRDNSEELGYSIAHSLLNGIADSIEFPDPEDPRRTAIMELLLSEERLRDFYLDLGGADPDKITAESSPGSIILAILFEVAGEQDRVDRFLEKLAGPSEPVVDNLYQYANRLGDWLLRSLRSFVEPFLKKCLAPLLIFIPRGYHDQFKVDPLEWVNYERFSDDAVVGGVLVGEILNRSMAGRFLDESIYSFLVEHETVEDYATPERLGVGQHFLAEIIDEEQLKALNAADGAGRLHELVGENLHGLRAEKPAALIKPDAAARGLNRLLAGLLPGSPEGVLRLSPRDFSLSGNKIMRNLSRFVDRALSGLKRGLGKNVQPLGNLPADLLDDPGIRKAKDEILGEVPGIAGELAASILEDERLNALLAEKVAAVVDELLDEALDVADEISQDPRLESAVEEAVVMVLTGNDLPALLGNLVGDLLEDELLLDFVDDVMAASRVIAVGDYRCPPSSKHYRPDMYLGGEGQEHGFEDEPDLPDSFFFTYKPIEVDVLPVGTVQILPAYHYFFTMGCNNGLYMFAGELREWLDPSVNYPHETPGSFLKEYLPAVYLTESRVRQKAAKPAAALLAGTFKKLPEERDTIKQLVLEGCEDIFLQKPLENPANYLRSDPGFSALLADCLEELPYDSVESRLRDNADIKRLLKEAFAALPLEEAAALFHGNKALGGLIDDAAVDINLVPLRPLLRVDRGLPQLLLLRAQAFPVDLVTSLLESKQHFNRLAYMEEDLKARFLADLVTNPDLIELESNLAGEKALVANYSLAQGILNVTEKFVGNDGLINYAGKVVFDFFGDLYKRVRNFLRSPLRLPVKRDKEALSPGFRVISGPARHGHDLFTKEVA